MCTTIVVGKNRSATGSVLMAHSEELGRNSAHKIEVSPRRAPSAGEQYPLHSGGALPQPPELPRYLATKIFDKKHYPGEHTCGVNEHGVMVTNNLALMKGIPEARAYDVVPGGVIWTEFTQLVLERARCAREGAALIGELCSKYGLSCDSGTMLAVADPDDAWWIELARGGQWAAKKVGPDEITMRANCYRIGVIEFNDHENFMYPTTLVDYARGQGWYTDGPFDFAAIYGDPANQCDSYNCDRHAVLESRYSSLGKVGVPELMRFMRDTFEGRPQFKAGENGSPFRTGVRTIARMNTEASAIVELSRNLSPQIGIRMWCGMSTSLTSAYVPFHLGINAVEPHFAYASGSYDPASAYWLFTELAKLADYGYSRCIETVTSTWQEFEAETFASLPEVEARAATLDPTAASAVLTAYDCERAAAAIRRVQQLLPEVKTKVFYEA
ncbi:MAG TPA: C69 family dipeptidase [Terriglobales bacterium]|nr:C69 family dipeptidase [Terriglobales bacterium]